MSTRFAAIASVILAGVLFAMTSAITVSSSQTASAAVADDPIAERTTDVSTIWSELWGRQYQANHSGMLLVPSLDGFEVHEVELNLDPQRDPRYDAVSVRGIGTFEKSSSVPMPWLTPSTSELAEKSLLDISVSAVSGTIVGDSQNLRHLVGIAMEMVHFDSSTTILLTPVSIEADSTDAQMHAELVAFVLGGDDPNEHPWQVPGTPPPGQQPPAPGYVWCFCSDCYLDCLEDSECDETYDYCVTQTCDPIFTTCRDGAAQVYDWCIGSCNCGGTPGIWCSARCWTCNANWGLQQSFCWSARVGCLSGCELAKTSCYSGCYLGSWSQYQNPPGCP